MGTWVDLEGMGVNMIKILCVCVYEILKELIQILCIRKGYRIIKRMHQQHARGSLSVSIHVCRIRQ